MRNPNDVRFRKIQELQRTGQMTGLDRPVGRVTYAKAKVKGTRSRKEGVGQIRHLFKSGETEHELFNIQSIDIDRSIGQDAATCTIVLFNVDPASAEPEGIDTEGRVGYLTPGRGHTPNPKPVSRYVDSDGSHYPTAWNYPTNKYNNVFVPNTILVTYQGYGSDNFDDDGNMVAPDDDAYIAPGDDTKLYRTGIWLIDSVEIDGAGTISVECRDFGKLLIEQVVYPPMIPMTRFPLIYNPGHGASGHKEQIGRNVARYYSASTDGGVPGANTPILGHRGTDAFDTRSGTYWLSRGHASASASVWLQAKTAGPVNEIVLDTVNGNYKVFVCVRENGHWQGTGVASGANDVRDAYKVVVVSGDTLWDLARHYYGDPTLWPRIAEINNNITDPHWIYPGQTIKLPYIPGTNLPPPSGDQANYDSPVTYVATATVSKNGKATIRLPRTYNASYVRLVFTNLPTFADGQHRAGVRTFHARRHVRNTYKPGNLYKPGYINDWSQPVKELCAWAGFGWPNAGAAGADPLLGKSLDGHNLRTWGDFEVFGAGPIASTPGDYFLAKTFMEAIRQIADFMGAIFYVDETGGAQLRLPNIWSGGNFIDDPDAPASIGARTKAHPIEFHENANLLDYKMKLSDENIRSEILVVGAYPSKTATGPVAGGYTLGYNRATGSTSAINFDDVLDGQYRLMQVPGDATKLFGTERECQRMAELTALFILFTYRQGQLRAPAHPALQIDDQVRIFERTTHENNIHYVSAVKTSQNLISGEYTMDVTTHWLGGDPNKDWFVNKQVLTSAVKSLPAVTKRLGSVTTGGEVPTGSNGQSGSGYKTQG